VVVEANLVAECNDGVLVGDVIDVVVDVGVDDDDDRCALMTKSFRGALPPVDFLSVCLVRAYN
jgi:hypothetical protein